MQRARHILAVTLVATALCADRMASAAPAIQEPVREIAGRLITRLSDSFQQVAPAARMYQPLRQNARPVIEPVVFTPIVRAPACVAVSPFQFRLPPPVS
jgi:hypothetical protein